jgi:hypothetical protein
MGLLQKKPAAARVYARLPQIIVAVNEVNAVFCEFFAPKRALHKLRFFYFIGIGPQATTLARRTHIFVHWEGPRMSRQEPLHDSSANPPKPHVLKRPVSERKIEANRRNAARSTGPKTERGKFIVSGNARKDGLLAREVVITAGHGKEDVEEFNRLSERVRKYYGPVGVIEEMLVEKIGVCWWRSARAIRAENGEIRQRLDTQALDRAQENSQKVHLDIATSAMGLGFYDAENQSDQRVSTTDRQSALQAAQCNLWKHSDGLEYLRTLLEIAKSDLADKGYISEKIGKKIFSVFSFLDYFFAAVCLTASAPQAKKEGKPEGPTDKEIEDERAGIVGIIDTKLETISLFERYVPMNGCLAIEADDRRFSLPPPDATEKIQRYEAHLDRQLYRAMGELERLQRRRRGEAVPPPVNINVGRRS